MLLSQLFILHRFEGCFSHNMLALLTRSKYSRGEASLWVTGSTIKRISVPTTACTQFVRLLSLPRGVGVGGGEQKLCTAVKRFLDELPEDEAVLSLQKPDGIPERSEGILHWRGCGEPIQGLLCGAGQEIRGKHFS